MFKNINKIKYRTLKSGFTLVELIVVIGIFLLISASILFDYGSFRSNVSLQNLTDDIALAVRKAQSFAIGSRGINNVFTNNYGVHFYIADNAIPSENFGSPKTFLMFSSPNKVYEQPSSGSECGSANSECLEQFTISSSDKIKDIILFQDISSFPIDKNNASLDIVFSRPETRAYFCYRQNITNQSCEGINISRVDILISNGLVGPKEKTRTISIYNTGQISTFQ